MPTSVALHLAIAFLLLFRLPDRPPEPVKEQSVNVELVPPPRPKAEEKLRAEPAKSSAKPSAPRPQAFESASARGDLKEEQQPLPKQGEVQDAPKVVEQPTPSETTPSRTETAARETPEANPAPPVLATPQPDATAGRSETEAASLESVPVPAQKPPGEKQHASKPAGAKVDQKSDELVPAKELFSPNALSNPRVKQALGKLPVKKRIVQICSIEALEQVRSQRPGAFPDMLVPYGPTGGAISTSALTARGGAFRSKANWYNVDFKCEVDADATAVVSFSFAIGGAVPKNEWDARQLPLN